MRIKPSQLVPGCILGEDVIGKTNRPIFHKGTVFTERKIEVLKKFLIPTVKVSRRLENGKVFSASVVQTEKEQKEILDKDIIDHVHHLSFREHYLYVVEKYWELIEKWKATQAIDIVEVREIIVPFLQRIKEIDHRVFTLYQFSSQERFFYDHSVSTALLSAYLGSKLSLDEGQCIQLGMAGLLANSGMVMLREDFIHSFYVYEKEKYMSQQMKQHPKHSYQLLKPITTLRKDMKVAVLQHHERLDGRGYPFGLKDEQIHKYARILSISERYYSLVSIGYYENKTSPFYTLKQLQKGKYRGLDPKMIEQIIRSFTNIVVGTKVKLSNQKTGKIVFIQPETVDTPIIKLDQTEKIINLEEQPSISIEDFT